MDPSHRYHAELKKPDTKMQDWASSKSQTREWLPSGQGAGPEGIFWDLLMFFLNLDVGYMGVSSL